MLTRYQASLDDRKKFTALVKDLFPDQAKNVNLLLMAYNMGIAQDIQSASHINNTFAFRYVKQLMDDFGMSRVNADWIVSVWCSCYGGKVLGKVCDISIQKVPTVAASAVHTAWNGVIAPSEASFLRKMRPMVVLMA